jgi:formylglycine-generating enzyme required for sulfatase activity
MKSMKHTILGLICGWVCLSATAEMTVSDVVARQQWPWKRHVRLDYVVSGFDAATPYEIRLAAFDGTRSLGNVPMAALSGDVSPVRNGKHTVEIDPMQIPVLADEKLVKNFRVEISFAVVTDAEILYRIYDLTKQPGTVGHFAFVTENALTNGIWGTWERDVVSGAASAAIWTGVTNDIKYATTHLVLRRIPAGIRKVGDPLRDYTITMPFYLAVFETTQYQYALMGGSTNSAFYKVEGAFRPIENVSYNQLRGTTLGAQWPDSAAVDAGSIIGNLRTMTGDATFDLPMEWQWEYACRAGVINRFNNNTANQEGMFLVGRCKENGGQIYVNGTYSVPGAVGITNGTMRVGGYAPNAWGLYDMHGNVAEHCRDWYVTDASSFTNDTQNATAAQAGADPKRVLRNGGWWAGWWQPCDLRAPNSADKVGSSNGFRVMMAE